MKKAYAIEFKNITKNFGSVIANKNISFQVQTGQIHTIIGENGAGKTTLMNQLFGLIKPTSGSILIDGKKQSITSPNIASELGLSMVHQHFQLVANHSVLENIVLGDVVNQTVKPIDYKRARIKLMQVSNQYNLQIDPSLLVKKTSVSMQQRIEILKMLYKGARILIFDEPTAMLTPTEIEGLLQLFLDLKNQGKTIIFISHKLKEIKKVADWATVIRKGEVVKSFSLKDTSISEIATMMVGRKLVAIKNQSLNKPGLQLLKIKNITVKNDSQPKLLGLKDFSLEIRQGEIVAIAGVEGNGQLELVNALFGLQKLVKGQIQILAQNRKSKQSQMQVIPNGNVKARYDFGMALVPENRHKYAILANQNLYTNAILQLFRKQPYSYLTFLLRKPKVAWTKQIVTEFDVRGARNGAALMSELSGGNQQKFIIGREMTKSHKLIIFFQPTRGLDIGAIEFVHQKILQEKQNGNGILLVSYELSEIMALADRIAVLNQGKLVNIANAKTVTREKIGEWMAGVK